MECFLIEGGHRLSGTIVPQGAKNEALQVISATLLTTEEVVIDNIPNILDVNNLIKLLTDIGVKVTKLSENKYSFCADEVNLDYLESVAFVEKCSSLRGSVLLYGPLLGRFGKATIAKPGGDKIGRRRLDTHFLGFKNLGAQRRTQRVRTESRKACRNLYAFRRSIGYGHCQYRYGSRLGRGYYHDIQCCLRALLATTVQHAQRHGRENQRHWQQSAHH